jgi:hypothetical protein
VVKIAQFGAVCETHSISQPIKTVGQNDLAFAAYGQPISFDRELHSVTVFKVDLASVRRCK